jgi:flagellar motor protein MotB
MITMKFHMPLPAILACTALSLVSCVSTKDHNDAVALAKHYQTKLHEAEERLTAMEGENAKLKKAIAQSDVTSLSEAGYGDIDARLSDLQARIDGLGRPLNDIERFDVEGGYVLMVQDKILFDSGSAELSTEGKAAIAKIADEIASQAHGRIWVRGHTDTDPVSKPSTRQKFPHGNLQLSAMRAVEVAAALSGTDKVKSRDIVVAGFGQYDPLRKNDSADNKRMNRRVEIFVADSDKSAAPEANK